MQITGDQIDDFKTVRKGITPPLPMIFRLVPILFYLSLVFLFVVGSLALWRTRISAQERDEALARVQAVRQDIDAQKAARAALEEKIRTATHLEAWVMASMPLQPLVVAIMRSMKPETAVVDLSIERDLETPAQLKFGMQLNTESDEQLLKTLEVIRSMNYREVSPTQTRVQGNLAYRASLLWQKPEGDSAQTPESRAAQPQTVQP
jgi:hypothetical protein